MWIDDDVSNVFSLVKMGLVPEHRRPLPPNFSCSGDPGDWLNLVDISYEDCWFPIRKCHESQDFVLWMLMKNVDPFSFPSCLWESKMLIWEPKWKLVTICPSPTLRQPPSGSPDAAKAHHGWHVHFLQPPVPLLPAEVFLQLTPAKSITEGSEKIRKQKEASATHLAWHSQNNQTSWDPVNLSQNNQNSPHPRIQLMFIDHARNISCIVTGACLSPQSLPNFQKSNNTNTTHLIEIPRISI